MKFRNSVRNIANSFVVLGVLALSLVTISQATSYCAAGTDNCLLASVSFGIPNTNQIPLLFDSSTYVSTTQYDLNNVSTVSMLLKVVQVTSIYIIMIGVALLIALEMRELHYLKKLVRLRKA